MTVSDPVHRIMVVISGAPDVGVATSGAVHQIRCSGAISGALGKNRGKKNQSPHYTHWGSNPEPERYSFVVALVF